MQQIVILQTIIAAILFSLFMAGLFFTWHFIRKAREKERLLLIEKGIDISNLHQSGKFKIIFPWLKIGVLITLATLGMISGLFLMESPFIPHSISGGLPMILPFLFGGVGMILVHYLDKPKAQQ